MGLNNSGNITAILLTLIKHLTSVVSVMSNKKRPYIHCSMNIGFMN